MPSPIVSARVDELSRLAAFPSDIYGQCLAEDRRPTLWRRALAIDKLDHVKSSWAAY